MSCIGECNCVSRRKNVIRMGEVGIQVRQCNNQKEAQLLATNVMKSKRKAYENASVEHYHFSDSESE